MKDLAGQVKQIRNKGFQIRKEGVKLSLFAGDMILYEDSTKKLPEVIDKFNKVSQYKINIQNQLLFYILIINYQKIKKTMLFTIISKQ